MADVIEGEFAVRAGWWIRLPQPLTLRQEQDGTIALESSGLQVVPQVATFNASGLTEPLDAIVAGIVDDTVADSGGALQPLGPIHGEGWVGHLCGGLVDRDRSEYQILASLGATGTTTSGTALNLTICYLGQHNDEQARWIVEHVVHRPDTAQLTNRLAEGRMHVSVPPGSMDQ